jgi:hypothetical protein
MIILTRKIPDHWQYQWTASGSLHKTTQHVEKTRCPRINTMLKLGADVRYRRLRNS